MKDFKIGGIKLPIYAVAFIVCMIGVYTEKLPNGMIGAFLFLIVLGELFNLIGNKTPIINSYFGGGAIVCIFGGAALCYYHLIPQSVIDNSTTFMKGGGFLDFYIAALITGSILGMNRNLLIKAAIRYLPCIIGATVFAIIFAGIGGAIFGVSFGEATAYISIPIMGGGMGAGAVPISNVFASVLNIPAEEILSKLVPAVALGNALAIVAGGLLDKLGKIKPDLTGNGNLVRSNSSDFTVDSESKKGTLDIKDYSVGIVCSTAFFVFGVLVSVLFKKVHLDVHAYAWMIITVAIVKALNILPEDVTLACETWYKFVAQNFTGALMLGIGIAYTELGAIIGAFTIKYLVLCALVVLGAIIGAGIVGHLVGFYFIESAITAGLCMANMGGTGDVAVLTAANRMELMPFAQISSRIGGALMILLATIVVPIFFG